MTVDVTTTMNMESPTVFEKFGVVGAILKVTKHILGKRIESAFFTFGKKEL